MKHKNPQSPKTVARNEKTGGIIIKHGPEYDKVYETIVALPQPRTQESVRKTLDALDMPKKSSRGWLWTLIDEHRLLLQVNNDLITQDEYRASATS